MEGKEEGNKGKRETERDFERREEKRNGSKRIYITRENKNAKMKEGHGVERKEGRK